MGKLIIGLGTGRCGTLSLAHLLCDQPGITMLHEGGIDDTTKRPLKWTGDHDNLLAWIGELRSRYGSGEYFGDIGMYYLPYVEFLLGEVPGCRFICLERPREHMVASYLKKTENFNHWYEHDGGVWQKNPFWDASFPKFPEPDKARALGLYWDAYHAEIERLVAQYPRHVACFQTEVLNSSVGMNAILDFMGYSGPRHIAASYAFNQKRSRLGQCISKLALQAMDIAMAVGKPLLPQPLRHFLWTRFASTIHERLLHKTPIHPYRRDELDTVPNE